MPITVEEKMKALRTIRREAEEDAIYNMDDTALSRPETVLVYITLVSWGMYLTIAKHKAGIFSAFLLGNSRTLMAPFLRPSSDATNQVYLSSALPLEHNPRPIPS